MRFSEVFAASSVATLVAAHGDIPIPKIFGMPKHMKARNPWAGHQDAAVPVEAPKLQVRQGGDANNRCGPSGGGLSCAAGFCCSAEGYCGNTTEHCKAPDCLIDFGPACDANKTPNGATTRNDARPQLGDLPYGVEIRSCLKPNTVAITYDDGPYIYTEDVLAEFDKYNAKATFFITGNNLGKGAIDENWQGVIQSMYNKGHQVASHTWSHQNLDQITSEQRYDQMVKNEMALRNILGKYPTYMRPPYSACGTLCQADLKALGYVITSFDLDTDDYNQLTVPGMEVAKGNFKKGIDGAKPSGSQLSIAHDIHDLTAHNLTPYMLKYVYDNGFTAVTVGECMNDPVANWYRDSTPAPPSSSTSSSSAPAPTPTGPTSTDGNCGTVNSNGKGQSCIGFVGADGLSECCSQYGYCGRSVDHCQTGCNPLFGKCGTQPSVSLSSTSSGPVPTPTGPTSTDGNCGTVNPNGKGQSCIGFVGLDGPGNCCSAYGYCGNTDAYCGTGCNPLYGKCGSSGSSSSVSASASASSSISQSASSSASVSSSLSKTSSASASPSDSKSASSTPVKSSSVSASSTTVKSSSASASVSKSASSSAAQSSASASSTTVKSSSVSASVSKSASSSAAQSSSASASPSKSGSSAAQSSSASISKPASSTPVSPSRTPSASASVSSYSTSIPHVSSTPAPSFSKSASSTSVQPSAISSVVKPSSASSVVVPTPSSGSIYPNLSTISTIVRPSSTPCETSSAAKPTPTKPLSKDGKCGKDNGGQTCAGYMNGFGWKIECCCKESGRCSTDPWACGVGCDKAYGNCYD